MGLEGGGGERLRYCELGGREEVGVWRMLCRTFIGVVTSGNTVCMHERWIVCSIDYEVENHVNISTKRPRCADRPCIS